MFLNTSEELLAMYIINILLNSVRGLMMIGGLVEVAGYKSIGHLLLIEKECQSVADKKPYKLSA